MLDVLREYEYCVGYRQDTDFKYRILYPTYRYWYADPMPVCINNKPFVFMEAYDKILAKGSIAVVELSDSLDTPRIIINEPFHMSFPNVFCRNDEYYMIPETTASGQIRIYKMMDSIYAWDCIATMDMGESSYTDIAVMDVDKDLYLIAGRKDPDNPLKCKTVIMHVISMEGDLKVEIVSENPEYSYDDRNGGNIYYEGGERYRVVQHSEKNIYGRYVTIHKIDPLIGSIEAGSIVRKIDIQSTGISGLRGCIPYGIHTYGRIDRWEVIDVGVKRLSLDGILVKVIRRLPKNENRRLKMVR